MVCFKCSGSGLKPCKSSQLYLKAACTVCKGVGQLKLTRDSNTTSKKFRPFKDLEPKIDSSYLDSLEEGICLTSLCGSWFLHQIEFGHKVTTDDYLVAAVAAEHFSNHKLPDPMKYLDLGTGLGSVLMLVTSALNLNNRSTLHGVEIQSRHVDLARRSLELNSVKATIFHSDLRDFEPLEVYDLITATPPYFPVVSGSLPISSNRAQCAFEMNGDVKDYLFLASKCLSKSSTARVVVSNGGSVSRTIVAGAEVGFECFERVDVHGKFRKDVLFSVYLFKWAADITTEEIVKDLYIRDNEGQFTTEYEELVNLVLKKNINS